MAEDTVASGNIGKETDNGNPIPASPSNDPPKDKVPSPDDKAALAAAEKVVADNKTKLDAAATKEAEAKKTSDDIKAVEDKKAQADKDATPLDTDKWGSTGHAGADAALGLLQNAGVTPEEAKLLMFDAVMEGDLSKVDMPALEAKIGKDKAKLVMIGADSFVSDRNARNAKIVADIKEVAGGEENWAKVTTWAKSEGSGVTDDQLGEWRGMIDAGGAQARFATGELIKAFNAHSDNTTIVTPNITPETQGDGGSPPSGIALNRNDYAAKVAKAHSNGRIPPQSELDELSAARKRGRLTE